MLIKNIKMNMIVNKQKSLKQIQEEFQNLFPFLKIEFYSGSHKKGEGSDQKKKLIIT